MFNLPRSFVSAAVAVLLPALVGACAPKSHDHPAGHEGVQHSFKDAERWAARFENPERNAWQKPEHVLAVLGLKPDARIADIGAGTGYFPIRFARACPAGIVYGIDLEPDMVAYLARRAMEENLSNLHAVQCRADDPQIPEPVDLIFLCNTFHHIVDRVDYFRRLHDDLRPGGRIAIVDFYKRTLPVGPPPEHKLSAEEVTKEMVAAGYRVVTHDTELPYQYVLVFEPAPRDGD